MLADEGSRECPILSGLTRRPLLMADECYARGDLLFEGHQMARRATKVKNESPTNKVAKRKSRMPRSNGSFAGMIAAERQRLQKVRQNIIARRAEIERELGDIERELKAM